MRGANWQSGAVCQAVERLLMSGDAYCREMKRQQRRFTAATLAHAAKGIIAPVAVLLFRGSLDDHRHSPAHCHGLQADLLLRIAI